MIKISEESINALFEAIKSKGEPAIVEFLKNVGIKEHLLKNYIINIACEHYNVSSEVLNKRIIIKNVDCNKLIAYFLNKYLKYKYLDIAYELNLKNKWTVKNYFYWIKKLNPNIKFEREFLDTMKKLDQKIILFINLCKSNQNDNAESKEQAD